jgi:uncharacterized protein
MRAQTEPETGRLTMSMRFTAVLGAGLLALALALPAAAQDQQQPSEDDISARISQALEEDPIDPERLRLARRVLDATDVTRPFDEILPDIADRAKTTLIRSNPQMQLGIINVVDKVALEMVERRAELENIMARIWAESFSDEELEELLAFYQSPIGQKYAQEFPLLLRAQIGAAEWWSREISEDMFRRVQRELQQMAEAEGQQLQQAAPPQPPAAPQLPGTVQ